MVSELIADGTDEAEERRRNLQELVNAALQYQEENEEGDLRISASAALASDADSKDTAADRVTLMTLHSSKGWSFVVCLVGMEQDCSPAIAPRRSGITGGGTTSLLRGHHPGERAFVPLPCQ